MQKLFFSAVWFLILGVTFSAPAQNDHFVQVEGNQFTMNGKPYYFMGTNIWYGCNLGAETAGGDRQRLIKELDLLKELGIDNLRILGASEGGTQHNTVNPPIQPQPGEYDENLLRGLDFLLAEMKKRDMVAVIYLNNYWVWSGGMAQYVSWFTDEPVPNPFKPEYSWDQFMKFSARFYRLEAANQSFRDYIKMLVNRTNTFTGIKYKEDPTIMSWQLANEPRPGGGDWGLENFEVFRKWIDETAGFIKSLDSNHLVSTGNEGTAGCMESAELFKTIHQFENIDYLTFHLWILNWSWFDPLKADSTYPLAEEKALKYLQQHRDFAREIGKPIVLDEFGIPRDRHLYSPEAATSWRDKFYKTIFSFLYEDAEAGGPCAGSNFWAWGGYGRPANPEEAVWRRGDDFTGDPPQEPQGRNSVFSGDSTTLVIIKTYAGKMADL